MSATHDVFGIKKIYKDFTGGPSWDARHWAQNGARTVYSGSKDPHDPTSCSENRGNVTWSIDGKGVLNFNGTNSGTTEPRFHLNNPTKYFFKNVECTFYIMRIQDNNTNWGGACLGVRSGPNGHSTSADYCDAHTYYQRMRHDGNMDFEKELKHPDSSAKGTKNIWGGAKFPFNKWVGYKSVTRNAGTGIKFQLYRDDTDGLNGGTWVKLGEYSDVGGWGPAQKAPACSYSADYMPLNGGGVIVLRNTGVTQCMYKCMTVREITSSYADDESELISEAVLDDADVVDYDKEEETAGCTTEHVEPSTGCVNCENGECTIPLSWTEWFYNLFIM
jgi:hypothetical protein